MSGSPESMHARIKRVIVDCLHLDGLRPEEIEDDAPLFGDGLGLDSVDALELVVGLEREFGIEIPMQDFDDAAFASVDALARTIGLECTRAGGGPGAGSSGG